MFGIGLSLSLKCQLTSEDIKQHYLPTYHDGDSHSFGHSVTTPAAKLPAVISQAGWPYEEEGRGGGGGIICFDVLCQVLISLVVFVRTGAGSQLSFRVDAFLLSLDWQCLHFAWI